MRITKALISLRLCLFANFEDKFSPVKTNIKLIKVRSLSVIKNKVANARVNCMDYFAEKFCDKVFAQNTDPKL